MPLKGAELLMFKLVSRTSTNIEKLSTSICQMKLFATLGAALLLQDMVGHLVRAAKCTNNDVEEMTEATLMQIQPEKKCKDKKNNCADVDCSDKKNAKLCPKTCGKCGDGGDGNDGTDGTDGDVVAR